jgi:hypothetical protein
LTIHASVLHMEECMSMPHSCMITIHHLGLWSTSEYATCSPYAASPKLFIESTATFLQNTQERTDPYSAQLQALSGGANPKEAILDPAAVN